MSPYFWKSPPLGQLERPCPQDGSHACNQLAVQAEDGPRVLIGEREEQVEKGEQIVISVTLPGGVAAERAGRNI